jgi:hypothetical protein
MDSQDQVPDREALERLADRAAVSRVVDHDQPSGSMPLRSFADFIRRSDPDLARCVTVCGAGLPTSESVAIRTSTRVDEGRRL